MFPIEFRKVSHDYGSKDVLTDISFAVQEKKITAIIGKSGSGKSTLLQMINGLLVPRAGEILVFEKPIDYKNLTELRRGIGYSVQGTGLFPHLKVFDNITLLARICGQDTQKVKERTVILMQLVDLDQAYLTKYPHELSGGEQQRVGICRAMILNPPIFLLDEAFGALDPATRNEIHLEVLRLQKVEPRTIVMVTHDLSEASRLADYLMVLDQGIIQQYDKCNEVLSNPANEFVATFIKSQREMPK